MPELPNRQHEAYAQARVNGLNKTHAAVHTGYAESAAHNRGSRLDKRPDVAKRIEELKAMSRPDRAAYPDAKIPASKNWCVNEFIRTYRLSRKEKQYSNCIQAILAIAKLQGHLVEQRVSYSEKHSTVTRSQDVLATVREEFRSLPEAERVRYLVDAPAEVKQALECAGEEQANCSNELGSDQADD